MLLARTLLQLQKSGEAAKLPKAPQGNPIACLPDCPLAGLPACPTAR